jgi:hypothetical protein
MADAWWLRVCEQILRGLNHALSNRIAGVAALAGVLEPGDGALVTQLQHEIGRLEHVLVLLRLVPQAPHGHAEAVRLQDLVPEAIELAQHHPDVRDAAIEVAPLETIPPLRCHPVALQHALVMLLVETTGALGRTSLRCVATDAAITIVVGDATIPIDVTPGRAMHPMALALHSRLAADGALVWDDGRGQTFSIRLPTLAALRARDRAGA